MSINYGGAGIKQLIQLVYTKYEGEYGYRQIQLFLLQDHGVWVNHKKVLRLMQAMIYALAFAVSIVTITLLLLADVLQRICYSVNLKPKSRTKNGLQMSHNIV